MPQKFKLLAENIHENILSRTLTFLKNLQLSEKIVKQNKLLAKYHKISNSDNTLNLPCSAYYMTILLADGTKNLFYKLNTEYLQGPKKNFAALEHQRQVFENDDSYSMS